MYISLKLAQLFLGVSFQLNKHRRMQKRFSVSFKLCKQIDDIVHVFLCLDSFVDIVCCGHHGILTHSLLHYLLLLHCGYKPVVDTKRNTAAICKMCKQSCFLGVGWILGYRPYALVIIAAYVVVGIELDCTGERPVKEVLSCYDFKLLRGKLFSTLEYFSEYVLNYSHLHSPLHIPRPRYREYSPL